jgi:hypothetical protein
MRVRVCLPLLLFVLAPIPAWADLIDATSGETLNRGSALSAIVAGSFTYDALGSGACTPATIQGCQRVVPSQSVELTVGHRRPLADRFQSGPDRLLGGLISPELHAGHAGLIDGANQGASAPPSATTIPGPSSLIIGVGGAIVGLALRVRKRSRTSMA